MAKIKFTAEPASDSTHRVSDECESHWFHWPRGYTIKAVQAAYQRGYDAGDAAATTDARIHRERDNKVISRWTF